MKSIVLIVLLASSASAGRFGYELESPMKLDACVERELHDGQWLAGACYPILHLTDRGRRRAHLGVAVLSNAEHGNTSFQLTAGITTATVADRVQQAVGLLAPRLADLDLPPWVGKLGHLLTLNVAGGYRPIHDASVNGNFTYGIAANINIPVDKVFDFLKGGL